jgi:hypothetical protein
MSDNAYVWKVDVAKAGSTKIHESLYFLAENFFELSHIIADMIFDNDSDMYPDFPVQILGMARVPGVGKIVNGYHFGCDGDGDERVDLDAPLNLSSASADTIIEFKCSCTEKVKVQIGDWPAVRCPHCKRIILRRDLSEVSGIWLYTPSNPGPNS